jgi:hypothetical protein
MFCQSQIIINTGRNTRPVLRPWWEIIRKGRINAATRPVLRPWWEIIRKGRINAATRPVLRPVGDYPQRVYQCSHAPRIAPRGRLSAKGVPMQPRAPYCAPGGRLSAKGAKVQPRAPYCAPWEIIRKGRINAATRPVLRPWWEIIRKGHKGAATRPVLRPVNNTPPAPVFAGYIGVYIRYRPPQKSPVYSCE